MTKQAKSIDQAIEAAPEPSELAKLIVGHMAGKSKVKFATAPFHDPDDNTYCQYGYVCWKIGLTVETVQGTDDRWSNTGYCVAADGSRALIVNLVDSLLSYDSKSPIKPAVSNYPDDAVYLWSPVLVRHPEDVMTPVADDDLIPIRDCPVDLIDTLEIIEVAAPRKAMFNPFQAAQRPLTCKEKGQPYAMEDQR